MPLKNLTSVTASSSEDILSHALISELEKGFAYLKQLPPAITFFGGARIPRGHHYFKVAEAMGELLAEHAIAPRTGAGPGIMTAVPEGFQRKQRAFTSSNAIATQGVNILLPFEQALNASIDVSIEIAHFPIRKLMLYENALGIVIFPGGLGTLDELFEIWRLAVAGTLHVPFVLFGKSFWNPILETLYEITHRHSRDTLAENAFSFINVSDDPEEIFSHLLSGSYTEPFEERAMTFATRISKELLEGLKFLNRLPRAVTVLGGTRLKPEDAVLPIVENLAYTLAKQGITTRASGPGPFSIALTQGGHRADLYLPQQAFGTRRISSNALFAADRVHVVSDRLTHKVLLTENSRAFIALPGGLGTLDELFSILCQIQTRKIPQYPVVLIGNDFWDPLWQTLYKQLLQNDCPLIDEADFNRIQRTDDADKAAEIALNINLT